MEISDEYDPVLKEYMDKVSKLMRNIFAYGYGNIEQLVDAELRLHCIVEEVYLKGVEDGKTKGKN